MSQITSSLDRLRDAPLPKPARDLSLQRGLAALLLGAILVIGALVVIIINILMASIGPMRMGMSPGDVAFATVALIVGQVLVLALGIFGLVLGIRGILAGRSEGESTALAWAGVLASGFGSLLWIMACVNMITVLAWWNRNPFR